MTKLKHHLLVAAILLLAFMLRVVAIDHIPPGLSHDEAYNGVTAIQVLEGQRLIFFEINKGIEPLIIYLEALAFYAFGIGPVPLRLVNVFCGLLTVALVYPLTARLFNQRVALLAMVGVAVSFWAIFVSRLTLRAITLPPLLILTLYFLWRGLESIVNSRTQNSNLKTQNSKLVFFALSGLLAGATMYTYLSSRFVPLLVLAIFGYQLVRRQIKRQHWLGLLIHFIIWAAILTPLAAYYWQNASSFTERSSQVTTIPHALNGEFGPMARNTWRTLGMFTFHGDETDRYNLDGRPVFDWGNGLLFYLGLGLIFLRLRGAPKTAGPAALLSLWFFFLLLPDFITDDSPHFLRTIGALPAVYIVWAVGIDLAGQQIKKWAKQKVANQPTNQLNNQLTNRPITPHAPHFPLPASRPFPLPTLFILIVLLLTTVHTSYNYFGRWATAAEARSIYGADIAEIARYLKNMPNDDLIALSAEYYQDLDPFRLALHFHGKPPFVIWFDGRQSLAFPPPNSGLSPRYIFAASAPPAEPWQPLLQASPGESGQEYMLYRLPSASSSQFQNILFSADSALEINVNNELIVSNYQVLGSVVSGGKFQVLLGWQALRPLPPGTDYTFLVRLWDNQGHLWAEDDGNGYLPMNWQPGVQGLQLLTLRLPGDLPPRTYHLTAEVVDRSRGQPLATTTGATTIPLTTLPGRLADKPRQMELERLPNPNTANSTPDDSRPLVLRGYKVNKRILHAGDTLSLTLHWQVGQQPAHDYQMQFFLTAKAGKPSQVPAYRWPAVEPIGGEWPTSRWPTGYWVQDIVDLPIEANIPRGQFTLRGTWVEAGSELSSGTEANLAEIELGLINIEGTE